MSMKFKMSRKIVFFAAAISLTACNGGNSAPAASGDSTPPASVTGMQDNQTSIKIVKWGPVETPAGTVFNPQSSGLAAVWMQMDQSMSQSIASIWWGDRKLASAVAGNGISAEVPAELYAAPGRHALQVRISRPGHETKSNVVYITIK
jgi:hypothetical protein